MEAASPSRELSGEKAQRIVDAMRTSVGLRGTTGSTFDHVAREAGVSRGLLHYYFGTKERLLVEVVRRDCDLRMERLSDTVAEVDPADGPDALLGRLVESLRETVAETPEFFVILLELHTLARRNEEIAAEVAELHRRVRGHLAMLLAGARDAGVIALAGEPESISEVLFALGDGLAMRMLAEPERDYAEALSVAQRAARALVREP
jgi:AcrR family transcriptional regulator